MGTLNIHIREAREDDQEWVADLMYRTLDAYYDGDHRAHAKRIFSAHMEGGVDKVGFFSFEQRMFIAEVNGERAGLIHVVGKRQQTYKISPLIVVEEFRGTCGIGYTLLAHAETYARACEARQLYCTVAGSNYGAMQFFVRHGFIRAGTSDSHYKKGVRETMLYKPLYSMETIHAFDRISVSVIPFEERHAEQVQALILKTLPASFGGISEEWVVALYEGYRRRHTSDVNSKYKLIFVASDSNGNVVGIAAATPKKGTPIKLMPFIATSQVAFDALLTDLPHQLAAYGHKLYIHINPTVEEVLSLQRQSWKLDAAMPGAYRPDTITQQWSLEIGATTMRTMRVKRRFFDLIRSGNKPLEVRVGYDSIKRIKKDERIQMMTHDESFIVRVVDKREYLTFAEMLKKERYDHIAPDCASAEEVMRILQGIYPRDKERLGVIVLQFKPE